MISFNFLSAALLSLGITCFVISAFFLWQEIGEINRSRSSEEQVSYWGMYPGKMTEIRREYKRLYPSGKIEFLRVAFGIAGLFFMVLLLVPLGFFR
jgi:hypothetical protein